MIFDSLIERIGALENPTVVGLDTAYDYLPDDLRAVRAAGSAKLRARSLRLRAPDEVTFDDAAADYMLRNAISQQDRDICRAGSVKNPTPSKIKSLRESGAPKDLIKLAEKNLKKR